MVPTVRRYIEAGLVQPADIERRQTAKGRGGVMIYDIPHNRNVTIMTKLDSTPTLGAMTKFVHPRPKKPQ